jgi:hypothetical protein
MKLMKKDRLVPAIHPLSELQKRSVESFVPRTSHAFIGLLVQQL